MAIFNYYVSSPEGICYYTVPIFNAQELVQGLLESSFPTRMSL